MDKNRPCEGYEEDLILYHYGELESEKASVTSAHMESCAACRAYMDELVRLLAAVPADMPGHAARIRAVDRVMAGIAPRRLEWRRRLVPAAIALTALVAAVMFSVYNPFVTDKPQTPEQMVMAQADPEVLENLDLLKDLNVIEELDTVQGMEEL